MFRNFSLSLNGQFILRIAAMFFEMICLTGPNTLKKAQNRDANIITKSW